MVLRAMAVVALAVLTVGALGGVAGEISAQEAERTVHVVSAGETLSDIANRYLGSAAAWQRLWDANRERLPNPDAIEPGLELVIPAGDMPVAVPGGVSEREVVTSSSTMAQPPRRAARPTGAAAAPRPSDRTVFFVDPTDGPLQGGVVGSQTHSWLAVPEHVFHSAGWLEGDAEIPAHVGTIGAFAGGENARGTRDTAYGYETLTLVLGIGQDVAVGDQLLTFRATPPTEEIGLMAVPTGMVTVHRMDGDEVVVVVTNEFGRVRLGDYVTPADEYRMERGVFPETVADSIAATVIAFQNSGQLVQGWGDLAFIDRGAADGLEVGDEFVASISRGGEWSGPVAGRMQVVRVSDRTAAARIVQMDTPIWAAGMSVRLARKMP